MREQLEKLTKPQKFRERSKVWFKQAEFDLKAAKMSLDHGFNEWATYQSEQSVEKAIKALLVHSGWKPPRIHKLQILIGMANSANEEFRRTKFNFRHLESFTFISRYPFLIPDKQGCPHELISLKDAKKAFEQAKDFVSKIAGLLKKDAIEPDEIIHSDEDIYSKQNIEKRLDDIREIIIREFNPEKIILFGSFARQQEITSPSTMDLLIIADTDLPFIDRIVKARKVTKGGLPVIEALVYTPQEFKLMMEEEGEGFLENAIAEGKEIFSK